jgi:hypothetical protein
MPSMDRVFCCCAVVGCHQPLTWLHANMRCLQGACVLFATPGMLHGGTSLEVFKAWAPDPKNLVLLPSYQVTSAAGNIPSQAWSTSSRRCCAAFLACVVLDLRFVDFDSVVDVCV